MRDAAVQEIVDNVLVHDNRLNHLALEVVIKGGVAHLKGTIPSELDRRHVREVVARIRGVDGVWDLLELSAGPSLKMIDLGCGGTKQVPDAVGVDAVPHHDVDIVADIERGLPFDDNEIDRVFAVHFLEHVRDLVELMNEIHRVLKPGGALHAIVPAVDHPNAVADPTHVRYFNLQTFEYFCKPHPHARLFRPICSTRRHDDVLADLEPVKGGVPAASETERLYYFH